MDQEQLKSIWAETIGSDDWTDASVELSYGVSKGSDTEDYVDATVGRRAGLPRARFTGIEFGGVAHVPQGGGQTIVVVDDLPSEPGAETVEPASRSVDMVHTIAYDEAMVSGATLLEESGKVVSTDVFSGESDAPAFLHGPDGKLHTGRTIGDPIEDAPLPDAPRRPSAGHPSQGGVAAMLSSDVDLREAGASYQIVDEIGRGGMGVIYRAVQASLEREVAVKTLIPDRATPKSREKFVSEALVTGALDHPNVVPVHELGRNQEGEVFLAMKLVDGRSWKDLLHPRHADDQAAAAGYTLEKHIDILLDVANAISFAHSKGLIHRDLKPENIMVGAYGETLVMDWGIAVDVRDPIPKQLLAPHRSTIAGPAGTPVYMSPEQAEGRGPDLGAWTDVYLLGAILHELVTGQAPHQRPGARLLDVLVTASRSEPPEYEDDVPRALQAICRKAMARSIDERYRTVAEFQEAVSTWLGHRASLRLADQADALAGQAQAESTAAHDRYGLYTRALARYEQALVAWPDNEQALVGQWSSSVAYANEALSRKDFGVVEAQLSLLAAHPRTDAAQLSRLRAGLRRQRASQVRATVALILVMGATLLGYRGLQAVAAQGEREGARVAAQHAFDRKAQESWLAVASGDLLDVSRAETRLAEDPKAREREGRDRVKSVRGAKKLMLWQQRRWQELFNIQCRDFRSGLLESGGKDPVVKGALVGTRVGELLRRAADDPSSLSLCKVFEAELLGGTPAKTVLAAFDQMQHTAPEAAQKRLLRRRRLLDAATCEMVPVPLELALKSTETDACLLKTLPFVLAQPPVGPQLRQRTRPPVMRRGKNHEWVALDRRTRKELWRTNPPGDETPSEVVIPVADGSVVIGSGAFLRRHDGRTGRVLGRLVLPSAPILAWPDTLDRRRMRVIAWTNRDQGRVGVLTFAAGRAYQPAFKSDTFEAWGRTSPTVIALENRQRAQLAQQLGVDVDGDDPRLRIALFKALIAEARRDPYEPDFAVRALHVVGAGIEPEKRARVADHAVRASKGLLPAHAVRIGNALLRVGFPRRAEQLYEQAANDFLDGHGNADLAGFRIGNPASLLRRLGAQLYEKGEVDSALRLVETGHRFATVMEGDVLFYQRYEAWLAQKGRQDAGGKVATFAQEAAKAGGVLVLAPTDSLLTDVAAVTVVLLPLLLLVLLAWLWGRARSSRIAALHAQGVRTWRGRVYAFLSDPWLRARHTFWSYATRPQRLVVLATAVLAILSATTLASNLAILGQTVTAPLHLAFGYPSQPAFLADVGSALRQRRDDPALRRLMAEGLRARGRNLDARKSLEKVLAIAPGNSLALNNLGVLAEEAEDVARAEQMYLQAGSGEDAGAMVARWNLARMQKSATLPTAALAHRDRIRARRYGARSPLWALCSIEDQRRLMAPRQTLAERAVLSFSQLLRGDFAHFVGADFGRASGSTTLLRAVMGGSAVLCLLTGALALIWLPLTTLPLLPTGPTTPGSWRARAGWVERAAALLVPGLRAVLSGRVAAGGALMLALCVLGALWFAIDVHGLATALLDLGDDAQFFANVQAPSVHAGFRPVGHAAGVALALIFAVNLALELRRATRPSTGRH